MIRRSLGRAVRKVSIHWTDLGFWMTDLADRLDPPPPAPDPLRPHGMSPGEWVLRHR